LFGWFAKASLYGAPFCLSCFVVCIREGFTPEKVAQLGCSGFLMLEYQKSSAAVPKQRNSCCLKHFVRSVFWLALAVCIRAYSLLSNSWRTNSPNQTSDSRSLWVEGMGR
jgi:hypothetical protein